MVARLNFSLLPRYAKFISLGRFREEFPELHYPQLHLGVLGAHRARVPARTPHQLYFGGFDPGNFA